MAQTISHALVLPDADFMAWLQAADAYTKAFERVGVIRSPAGNDLNRFRDITAVEAPGVWVRNNTLDYIQWVMDSHTIEVRLGDKVVCGFYLTTGLAES